jgi:DNA (cytosine-5)-methyltransferase 1
VTVGSLFAGIGGLDLGLERAGMEVRWQVERDSWCQQVLAKHWPDVRRYGDIALVTGHELEPVDVLCGGFPCQPVSVAGQQKGTDDDRWLWPSFRRLVGVVRPRYVLVENVPGLFTVNRGHAFGEILADLAQLGYDCEWTVLSAADVGAPHLRKRVWIVADADRSGREERRRPEPVGAELRPPERGREEMADADKSGRHEGGQPKWAEQQGARRHQPDGCGPHGRLFNASIGGDWEPEPQLGRVATGIPGRVDRLRGIGNSVVPQCAEWVARRIIDDAQRRQESWMQSGRKSKQ